MLTLLPPDRVGSEDRTPKEIVFVLDTSGSMAGFPLDKAKEAITLSLEGLYPNDTWSGPEVGYLRRRCKPGRLTVDLSSDPSLFSEPQTVVARSNGALVYTDVAPPVR